MNFRQHTSKQGTLFIAGKSSETNELLVEQIEKNEDEKSSVFEERLLSETRKVISI